MSYRSSSLPGAKASRSLLRSVFIRKMSIGEPSGGADCLTLSLSPLRRERGLRLASARLILPVFLHTELAHRRSVKTSLVLTKSSLFLCTCSAPSIKFNTYHSAGRERNDVILT